MTRPMSPARRTRIRARADALLSRRRDGERSFDFLRNVCDDEGIQLYEADLHDMVGVLRHEEALWRLYLNREDSPHRRLLTLAHTLGHYFLHAESGRTFVEGGLVRTRFGEATAEEHEAIEFAACLLMPLPVIRDLLADEPPTVTHVVDLAARFGLSAFAVVVRLRSLGYQVAAPVV